jgi:hypothetical protein
MRTAELHHVPQNLGQRRRWCVPDTMLRAYFPSEPHNTFYTALSRHVRQGTLQRLSPGLYRNPYAPVPPDAAEQLASFLRPDDFAYLSLESALHEHGWISQIPARLTFMTSGRSWTYHTPVGTIEFTHTERDADSWRKRTTFDTNRRFHIASPQLAYEDLKRVGRNLDLVEPED